MSDYKLVPVWTTPKIGLPTTIHGQRWAGETPPFFTKWMEVQMSGERFDVFKGLTLSDYLKQQRNTPKRDRCGRGIHHLARLHGMKPSTVKNRLKRGWPLEKALTTPLITPKSPMTDDDMRLAYELRHRYRLTVREIAEKFEVPERTMFDRLRRYTPKEEEEA